MAGRYRTISQLIQTARPRQWAKNVLVMFPGLIGGTVFEPQAALAFGIAFAAFCLAASGVYFVNDVRDAEQDRQHDTKRSRPVAARTLSPSLALVVGGCLVISGLGLGFAVRAGPVIALYIAISLAYCIVLRDVRGVDLVAVASGFPLRVIAGAQAGGISTPSWLLVVVFTGALFVVAGKRYSEAVVFGELRARIRPSLAHYRAPQLRRIVLAAAVASVASYALGAAASYDRDGRVLLILSLIPYTLVLVRYAVAVRQARGSSPEHLLRGDRVLQLLGVIWFCLFAIRTLP
ncbi:decaprenyl-phosphate phosphoribosyltransferase [Herbidospora mongoliensis]|uniref:decaprenyl-phosphate phosphoribosyltransferase n=1 Tax=Herbidospora mongoliensis TaxID=688067 RepID=UPI00082EAE6A|nr:decaprenyl-phosphate phosphoribosyltransferase [Herbidospora mongoliensis]